MRIYAAAACPPEIGGSWADRWEGPDQGLLVAWAKGREMRESVPQLVELVKAGALPVLAWKGGVERVIKGAKIGSLHYLAARQGMLGLDLDLDMERDYVLRCSATGVEVVFTANVNRLLAVTEDEGGRNA